MSNEQIDGTWNSTEDSPEAAEPNSYQWAAVCLDLCLYATADTHEDARYNLIEQIRDYLYHGDQKGVDEVFGYYHRLWKNSFNTDAFKRSCEAVTIAPKSHGALEVLSQAGGGARNGTVQNATFHIHLFQFDPEAGWETVRQNQIPGYFTSIWPDENFEIERSFPAGYKISKILAKYNGLKKSDISRVSNSIKNLNAKLSAIGKPLFTIGNLLDFTGHAIYGYDRKLNRYNNYGKKISDKPLIASKKFAKDKREKISKHVSQLQNLLASVGINPRFDALALKLMATKEFQKEALPSTQFGVNADSRVIRIQGLLEGLRLYCDYHLSDEGTPHQNRADDSKNSNRSRYFCRKLNKKMKCPPNVENEKRELIRQLCIALVWKGDPRDLDTDRLSEWLGPLSPDLTP